LNRGYRGFLEGTGELQVRRVRRDKGYRRDKGVRRDWGVRRDKRVRRDRGYRREKGESPGRGKDMPGNGTLDAGQDR
jgi:hypothetical protein